MKKIEVGSMNISVSFFNDKEPTWTYAIKTGIALRLMGRKKITAWIEESIRQGVELSINEAESQGQEYLQ